MLIMQGRVRFHFAANQLPSATHMILSVLVLNMRNTGSHLLQTLCLIPPNRSRKKCIKDAVHYPLEQLGSASTLSSTSRSQYSTKSFWFTFPSLICTPLRMHSLG